MLISTIASIFLDRPDGKKQQNYVTSFARWQTASNSFDRGGGTGSALEHRFLDGFRFSQSTGH